MLYHAIFQSMDESDFKQVDEFVSKIENWLELMENIFGKGVIIMSNYNPNDYYYPCEGGTLF